MKPVLLWILMSAGTVAAVPAPTNTLSGTWTWQVPMPDGTAVKSKARLQQTGTELTGTTSFRPGTESLITNGWTDGHQMRFDVVRTRHGVRVTSKYSGQVSTNKIIGQVESDWNGVATRYPWEARASGGLDGTWRWASSFGGGRRGDSRVTLKVEGETVTGSMPSRDGTSSPLLNGSFKEDKVYFEVERGRDDARFLQKYEGILDGDVIVGKSETGPIDNPRRADWEARRVE